MNNLLIEPIQITKSETFDVLKAAEAQAELCKQTREPHFAPYQGVCYGCKRNIYEQVDRGSYQTGISVVSAGISHITGCPHCQKSYCD
ncbi:MAG: hypothetical protein WKF97_08350 [Chitinophagaceae bacterium]